MTPERWKQVKEVLATAREMAPGERPAYLQQSCANDDALRLDVESLLAEEQRLRQGFLQQTDLARAAATLLPDEEKSWIGRRVGSYRIVERIGAGGMGEVYRAIRADDLYRKEVALKLVGPGLNCAFVVDRFKNERQILAGLDHPNIARLLDGGTTEEGLPYFVMELIEGQPITEYCEQHHLSVTERLTLFLQVCLAVQFAHQRLIIHRDIKPRNILVTQQGLVRLLDFGIAKVVDADAGDKVTDATQTEFRILTPRYASPEQIRGEAITTASDVYSLGVVLYEVLTGQSPYGPTVTTPQQTARAVCDSDPEKPSAAARRKVREHEGPNGQSANDDARVGDIPSEKLRRQLSGDLDTIVLMALRKEPARRYPSVERLAEDIRRHLENLPVTARADTVRYRTSKFVRRHKFGVVGSAIAVLALLCGLSMALYEAHMAERRFNDVRKLANSLIFEMHDSIQDLPGSTPARKLLVSRAIEYLDSLAQESSGDASLQAELADAYEKVGRVQGGDFGRANLGDNEAALVSFRKMLAIRQSLARAKPRDVAAQVAVARSYRVIADLYAVYLGDLKAALETCAKALAITEPLSKLNPTHERLTRELAADYEKLGDIQGGGNGSAANLADLTSALANHVRSHALVETLAARAPADRYLQRWLGVADFKLQNDLNESDDLDAATLHAKEAAAIFERLADQSNNTLVGHDVAAGYDALAKLLERNGRFDEALPYFRKEVSLIEPSVTADPNNVEYAADLASAQANVGYTLCKTGKCREGIPLLQSALAVMGRVDPSGRNTQTQASIAAIENCLADALEQAGRWDEELDHYAHARKIYQSIAAREPMDVSIRTMLAAVENGMAGAHARQGQLARALTGYQDSLNTSIPLISATSGNLRAIYCAYKSYAELGDTAVALAKHTGPSRQRRQYFSQARNWYQQSLDMAARLPHKASVDTGGFASPEKAIVVSRLAQCDQALATMRSVDPNQ